MQIPRLHSMSQETAYASIDHTGIGECKTTTEWTYSCHILSVQLLLIATILPNHAFTRTHGKLTRIHLSQLASWAGTVQRGHVIQLYKHCSKYIFQVHSRSFFFFTVYHAKLSDQEVCSPTDPSKPLPLHKKQQWKACAIIRKHFGARDLLPLVIPKYGNGLGRTCFLGWENGSSNLCLSSIRKTVSRKPQRTLKSFCLAVNQQKSVKETPVDSVLTKERRQKNGLQDQASRFEEKASFRRERLRLGLDMYPNYTSL